jgi:H/ACA ribonucleoprotein complex subunit 3
MDLYAGAKKIRLDPSQAIGKGGEADVYDIGGGMVAKIFKPPTHPDFTGLSLEQRNAAERIAQHQRKLRQFPQNLPPRVVAPAALVTDKAGQIVGYTMPFLSGAELLRRYSDRSFRVGVPNDTIVAIFRDLWGTVDGTHRAGVVIGDFNDLNVLVRGAEAHLIDADSMQFGGFPCRMFTARFVDPTRCDPHATALLLNQPHTEHSDWYAFAIMLFQSLLFVDPYGGVYVPKDATSRIPHDQRPLKRISVFHPDVRYPKPAQHYRVLPDDLLQYFHQMLEKDERGTFPHPLLEQLRWTTCTQCGIAHARSVCPTCATAAPAAIRETTVVRGKVTATRIFRTPGVILYACVHDGELKWLAHESDTFQREDRSSVLHGALDPAMRYRITGTSTFFLKDGQVVGLTPGAAPEQRVVDTVGHRTTFDANGTHAYWAEGGRLYRDGHLGPERIGDVLRGQTHLWVGPTFGFGLYRAGTMSVAFVFDAERRGINDAVALPSIRGQLVDATCAFSDQRCWFFTATQDRGKTVHRATVIKPDGSIEATAEAESGDGSWLGTIRGKAAAGNFLLAATDDGVVRVEPDGSGGIAVTKAFPDTEPFVDAGCILHIGRRGLYVISKHEITVLKLQ